MRRLLLVAAASLSATAHAQTISTIDTPAAGRTSEQPAVVIYQGQPAVFVSDRDVATNLTRLKWCRPSFGACMWTVIDGGAGDLAIPATSAVKPIVWSSDGRLHLFYTNRISGSGVLRHAVLTTTGWYFENLDGLGGAAGRIAADLNGQINAVDVVPGGGFTGYALYVSYYDATNGNLRLAKAGPKIGWSFSTLDGDTTTGGRIDGNIGRFSTLIAHNGVVNALYTDTNNADIRQAQLLAGGWSYQTIDGNGAFTTDYVVSPIAAVVSGPWLHIMYNHAATGAITHAWSAGGGAWGYADHDGSAAALARTSGAGCSDGNLMYFPYSFGLPADVDLKVTTSWSSSPWGFGVWDGHVNDGMHIFASVGQTSACAGANYRAYFAYTHDLGGGRTAIRYAFTDPPS